MDEPLGLNRKKRGTAGFLRDASQKVPSSLETKPKKETTGKRYSSGKEEGRGA